jgi:hypothetical protein
MSNFHPFFIPFSKLNGKKCLTHKLQNFTGKLHITSEGVLLCCAEYSGLEEDLERTFDRIQLCEMDRQLLRGVMLESPPVTVVINDEEAATVAAATAAAAAADGVDGYEEGVAGDKGSSGDADDINGDDNDEEDDDEDDDTVTDLPSANMQFDSDDDSYDEDKELSQQVKFF